MSDIESLKAAIAETNESLSQKVKILEVNVKGTASSIKDSVEQGAAQVRSVANALSPAHHIKEHPLVVCGALIGIGVYLGSKPGRKRTVQNTVSTETPTKEASTRENLEPDSNSAAKVPAATGVTVRAIAEPAMLGLLAAAAGEVVKRYFPQVKSQATAVQSALIAEMTTRIVNEFK